MKAEVAVLGSPILTGFMVSVDVKQHGLVRRTELRSSAKVEAAVLSFPTLTHFMVSVDVKVTLTCMKNRVQQLCEC